MRAIYLFADGKPDSDKTFSIFSNYSEIRRFTGHDEDRDPRIFTLDDLKEMSVNEQQLYRQIVEYLEIPKSEIYPVAFVCDVIGTYAALCARKVMPFVHARRILKKRDEIMLDHGSKFPDFNAVMRNGLSHPYLDHLVHQYMRKAEEMQMVLPIHRASTWKEDIAAKLRSAMDKSGTKFAVAINADQELREYLSRNTDVTFVRPVLTCPFSFVSN